MEHCVDIENKTLYFGYGGIDIHSIYYGLEFRGIKPPQGAGQTIWKMYRDKIVKVGNWEHDGNMLTIHFKGIEDIQTFCQILDHIEERKGQCSISFNNIKLNFDKYVQASMDILKYKANVVRYNMLQVIAC